MSLRGFFQIGYVTHDLDRAIATFGPFSGVNFTAMYLDLSARTPTGDRTMGLRIGTGWLGHTQIELIEPVSGHVGHYRDVLPDDRADTTPRLHHLAVRRDDAAQMREEVALMDLPLVFETGGNGITSLFVDARARMGHHLELVAASPEGWAMLGWPA